MRFGGEPGILSLHLRDLLSSHARAVTISPTVSVLSAVCMYVLRRRNKTCDIIHIDSMYRARPMNFAHDTQVKQWQQAFGRHGLV